jgi:hypothetical protein
MLRHFTLIASCMLRFRVAVRKCLCTGMIELYLWTCRRSFQIDGAQLTDEG